MSIFNWLFPTPKCSPELLDAVYRHKIATSSCRATMVQTQDSAIDHIYITREETKQLKKLAKDSGEQAAVKEKNGEKP